MLKIKGNINKEGEVVFQIGKPLPLRTLYNQQIVEMPVEICLELSVTIGLNSLISGIDGIVWASKNVCQADIIVNSLKIQNIESEIIQTQINKVLISIIKVNREEDVKIAIDFIQNDKSGLRLKPDWYYPEGERNQSFEQWLNE